jgi:predicted pyridoxine 5'-phosphate oxidase superfamily flavin-nucleotide-binding protein
MGLPRPLAGRMSQDVLPAPVPPIDRLLRSEPVIWLSTVRPDGGPHLVPIWFSWNGRDILIASKPHAQKIRNLRANPTVTKYGARMAAIGLSRDEFLATYSQ